MMKINTLMFKISISDNQINSSEVGNISHVYQHNIVINGNTIGKVHVFTGAENTKISPVQCPLELTPNIFKYCTEDDIHDCKLIVKQIHTLTMADRIARASAIISKSTFIL